MQCIAGVHYNYSLADGLWDVLDTAPGTTRTAARAAISG